MSKASARSVFTQWIEQKKGHDYYISFFDRKTVELRYEIYDDVVYAYYNDYLVLTYAMDGQKVRIVNANKNGYHIGNSVIQEKLIHEYVAFFELDKKDYVIVRDNFIYVEQYIRTVTGKIDAGFLRYEELFSEQKVTKENVSFARIDIDNAFSLEELNTLISAYNRLYSIIACVYEYGYENALQLTPDELCCSHAMILESIHIGSKGDVVTAGIDAFLSLLTKLVNLAFEGDKLSYEAHKAKVEAELAHEGLELQKRESAYKMICMLDNYMERKMHTSNPAILTYIENEINILMANIDRLQGTKHINLIA